MLCVVILTTKRCEMVTEPDGPPADPRNLTLTRSRPSSTVPALPPRRTAGTLRKRLPLTARSMHDVLAWVSAGLLAWMSVTAMLYVVVHVWMGMESGRVFMKLHTGSALGRTAGTLFPIAAGACAKKNNAIVAPSPRLGSVPAVHTCVRAFATFCDFTDYAAPSVPRHRSGGVGAGHHRAVVKRSHVTQPCAWGERHLVPAEAPSFRHNHQCPVRCPDNCVRFGTVCRCSSCLPVCLSM